MSDLDSIGSSSDGSVMANVAKKGARGAKNARVDIHGDDSAARQHQLTVRNAESSDAIRDDKGWILWTKEEDEILLKAVNEGKHWTELSKLLPNKTARHCRKRYNVALNFNLRKGNWTSEEDQEVVKLVEKYGEKWAKIATEMVGRTADQIRGRYLVSLNPTNNTGPWTSEEYRILLSTHYKLGNQWVAIAKHLPGRQNKFISNHFKESVARKVEIFVNAKQKQSFGELTDAEVDELITYLHIKVAGAMKPLLKGNANLKKNIERTQMGGKRRRSSALLAASLTEGSKGLLNYPSSASAGDEDEPVEGKVAKKRAYQSLIGGDGGDGDDSSDDSVGDLLASLEDGHRGNRGDKPKYVKTSWTAAEDELLKSMFQKNRDKPQKWKVISHEFNKVNADGVKDETQCERRWRNMPFTAEDDAAILAAAPTVGTDGVTWKEVAKRILGHSGTQCQERWIKLSVPHHHSAASTSASAASIHVSEAAKPVEVHVQEAAIEVMPMEVVSKFKKAKLTASKAAAAASEPEAVVSAVADLKDVKGKPKIKNSSSAIVDTK